MKTTLQLAKHIKEFHFGGNWTAVNLKDLIADVSWQQANTSVFKLNSIATLVFHINYYIHGVLAVLEGKPLEIKDAFSFDLPPIHSEEDWEKLKRNTFNDAEKFVELIEKLPHTTLSDNFTDEKYGNYFRNILGIIEHSHYHLGQIALIKKIVLQTPKI